MPSVLLIRHGQASFGAEDYDRLSELGASQAELTGAELLLQAPKIVRVVSGTLRRQFETAAALDLGPVDRDPRWDEFDAGEIIAVHGESPADLEGRRSAGMDGRHFQDSLDPALAAWIVAGEDSRCKRTWPAFQAEMTAALDDVGAGLARGETAVVVSSAGAIAAAAGVLLGAPAAVLVALNRTQINCAVSKVAVGARGNTLISVNDHSHLQRVDRALVTYR